MSILSELEKYDVWREEVANQTLDFTPESYLKERDKMRAVELVRKLKFEEVDHAGVREFTFETEVGEDPTSWI